MVLNGWLARIHQTMMLVSRAQRDFIWIHDMEEISRPQQKAHREKITIVNSHEKKKKHQMAIFRSQQQPAQVKQKTNLRNVVTANHKQPLLATQRAGEYFSPPNLTEIYKSLLCKDFPLGFGLRRF